MHFNIATICSNIQLLIVVILFYHLRLNAMKNQTTLHFSSVAQECSAFLTILHENKDVKKPLLKKDETPLRLVHHLEKQFGNKAA